MPSIFEHLSTKMAKQLGGRDLRPVKYLMDAKKFCQLNILRKNSKSRFWEKPNDDPIGFSLMDILDAGSPVPESVVEGPLPFIDTVVQAWKMGAEVDAGLEIGVSGEVTQMHESTLEYQFAKIPLKNLQTLQNSKLRDPEPSFLKDCRRRGDNLYVVTEIVELTNQPVLRHVDSLNTSGKLSIPWNTIGKVRSQGEGRKERETKLTLPRGTVIAYKKQQLVITEEGCAILNSADSKQKTFQDDKWWSRCSLVIEPAMGTVLPGMLQRAPVKPQILSSTGLCGFLSTEPLSDDSDFYGEVIEIRSTEFEPTSDTWIRRTMNSVLPLGRIEEPFGLDFKFLQQEVSENAEALAVLTKDIQDVLFHNVLSMLRDRGALKALLDMLELDSLGHLDGPGGVIIEALQQSSEPSWVRPQSLILYLLQALMVLSDTQLDLLAQSVEKGILRQQQELVRSILEPNFRYPWCIPFRLPSELLAKLQGEGVAITYGLLEECGLKMEQNSPNSTWVLDAKMPLSALYGTLSLLQQLVEA